MRKFSGILTAIAAMFSRQAAVEKTLIQSNTPWGSDPVFPKDTPHGEFHPIRNQRKKRLALRRLRAAGGRV